MSGTIPTFEICLKNIFLPDMEVGMELAYILGNEDSFGS
jgi:hypothetical protein